MFTDDNTCLCQKISMPCIKSIPDMGLQGFFIINILGYYFYKRMTIVYKPRSYCEI